MKIIIVPIKDIMAGEGISVLETEIAKTALLLNEIPNLLVRETPYYSFLLNQLNVYGNVWGYIKSKKDILDRCEKYRMLFHDVKRNGLRNPVNVFLKDDGTFLSLDGQHRASIMNALGYKYIRAFVGAENLKWIKDSDQIRGYSSRFESFLNIIDPSNSGIIYQRIEHPFFDDYKVGRDSRARFFNLLNNVSFDDKILDIGCHIGYLPRSFSGIGIKTDGVDLKPESIRAAMFLKGIYKTRAEFFNDDAIDFLRKNENKYSVVFLLSIIHHMEKHGGLEYLKKLFSLTPKKVFIEVINSNEKKEHGVFITEENLEKWLIENTKYKKVTQIFQDFEFQRRKTFLCEG